MGFRLDYETPSGWVARVEEDTLALLSDHAHCELKAAASAQAMVAKNGHHSELVDALSAVAIEELEHFTRVHGLIRARGGTLEPQDVNPYAEGLLERSAATRKVRFLDRLLVAELIEARSLERFHLLSEHLRDAELAELYGALRQSEAGHQALFERLAKELYDEDVVEARRTELRAIEADVVANLPFAFRIHSGVGA
ncbi:MAG: tRNA-(ms[2]io[6]A)-hydroxylase [Planctomycetota bacterium]|nr:tRNA-(ms[2]io[6]A)-hydroxylase [Planctomycetota bacterium]